MRLGVFVCGNALLIVCKAALVSLIVIMTFLNNQLITSDG